MSQYFISYLGGNQPASEEESELHYHEYKQWLASLGEAVVRPARPFRKTCSINEAGEVTQGTQTSMSGYSIIEADSMDAAIEIAKQCPFLHIGGALEVSELIDIEM